MVKVPPFLKHGHHQFAQLRNLANWNHIGSQSYFRDRALTVSAHYFQSTIREAAKKESVRLSPASLLYTGRNPDNGDSYLIQSAQYLYRELPVRLAHRIAHFHALPFIIASHPAILAIQELYIRSFKRISECPPVTDLGSEIEFSRLVKQLLDDHRDVVSKLADGFKECIPLIEDRGIIRTFLDQMLTSRLAIRILAEHHVALHETKPNFVGVICTQFHPRVLVQKKVDITRRMCLNEYGRAPDVRIEGHVDCSFPYIVPPVDYILGEILKNAFRATVESNKDDLPDVVATVANNATDFIIRISDKGGGIPHEIVDHIWEYSFTTSGNGNNGQDQNDDGHVTPDSSMFKMLDLSVQQTGTMHGYGFGLPACHAYAEFLAGKLSVESMQGIGTDVYLRLTHIDSDSGSFWI